MSATTAISQTVYEYIASSIDALKHGHILRAFNPFRAFQALFLVSYILFQSVLIIPFFKQRPPRRETPLSKPSGRIAVIGAGLTGISSAAHCISHNFEVVIFEKKKKVGGIWGDVNRTSALQLNSLIYRFHPAVLWRRTYPPRDEILSEITRIWKEYKLEPRTRLNTPVYSVRREEGSESPGARWIINEGNDGPFDAVIVTVGTCGKPQMAEFPGMPRTHWAVEQDDENKAKKDIRKKQTSKYSKAKKPEDGGRSYQQTQYKLPVTQQNTFKKSDGDEKRREKERKERERKEKERKKDQERRNAGRGYDEDGASSFAEVASHPPADDSVAINDAPESGSSLNNEPDKGPSLQDPSAPTFAEVASQPPTEHSAALNSKPEKAVDNDAESESELWMDVEDDDETFKEPGSEPGDNDVREPEKTHSEETYKGTVLHSSELDGADLEGKTVLIIGSGASGVEAAETALERGAKKAVVIAREDKWIIPRNTLIDTLISAQPFGRQMPLSFLWEWFIRTFHYRDLKDLSPANLGIYEGTPVVNSSFLDHIRQKRIDYVRGDTERLTSAGVRVSIRPRGTRPGDRPLASRELKGEVVVLATGFERPSLDMLPHDLFPVGYNRPDLYLQNFSTKDWSILCTNSSYMNAIGTVGHFHIGIYTRILLLFLLDHNSRPEERDMRLWVDVIRFVKRGAQGGALGFFTYMELVIWFLTFHAFRPDRLRWIFFTMQGWGVSVIN